MESVNYNIKIIDLLTRDVNPHDFIKKIRNGKIPDVLKLNDITGEDEYHLRMIGDGLGTNNCYYIKTNDINKFDALIRININDISDAISEHVAKVVLEEKNKLVSNILSLPWYKRIFKNTVRTLV